MASFKRIEIIPVETEDDQRQIFVQIKEDLPGKPNHRRVIDASSDISSEAPEIQAVIAAAISPEAVSEWRDTRLQEIQAKQDDVLQELDRQKQSLTSDIASATAQLETIKTEITQRTSSADTLLEAKALELQQLEEQINNAKTELAAIVTQRFVLQTEVGTLQKVQAALDTQM